MGKKGGRKALARAGSPARSTAIPVVRGTSSQPYLDQRSIIALGAVWRCVRLIADAISDMPWTEWRGAEQLPISRLVRRPYVGMTRREWTWRVTAAEALYSCAYLLHVGGADTSGAPWSLLPVPNGVITPAGYTDPYGIMPPTAYAVGADIYGAEYVTVIRRDPFPGVPDYVNGVVNIARVQFSAYLAADYVANRYWLAGGPPNTVLTSDQEIDDPEADRLADRWVDKRTAGNDRPIVLGKGAKAEPWGADPTTEAAVDARKEIVADVGRYFGIPTRILNAPAGDTETYSNVESDEINLYRHCLRGYIGPVEDAISDLLPGDPLMGRRMELDPTRLLQGDLASRATAYSTLVGAGIFTQEEARVRGFGLAPAQAAPAIAAVTVEEIGSGFTEPEAVS